MLYLQICKERVSGSHIQPELLGVICPGEGIFSIAQTGVPARVPRGRQETLVSWVPYVATLRPLLPPTQHLAPCEYAVLGLSLVLHSLVFVSLN